MKTQMVNMENMLDVPSMVLRLPTLKRQQIANSAHSWAFEGR